MESQESGAANFRKHGVGFGDAVFVLEGDLAITLADESAEEDRWATIGMDAFSQ